MTDMLGESWPLGSEGPTGQPNCPANFALGSASTQLQEVLVTDLPRSSNIGERERETREGGGEPKKRKKRREGEREEGRAESEIEAG